MKFTQLFTKTQRESSKDETAESSRLLTRGSFIFKNMAGVYSLLPLGLRVIKKIEQIIREEMDAIGGQEVHLNILQDPQVWRKSGRWDKAKEVMFQFRMADDGERKTEGKWYGLGFTHEEVVAQIAALHINSYKDLPKYVYQIQTKFRNEPRVQAGLLRTREFSMKDLYSLTADQQQLDEFYEKCAQAYLRIFKRLKLEAIRTKASGGVFSKYSDEFQVLSDIGEDTILVCPDKHCAINKEIIGDEGKPCKNCGKDLVEEKSIEVGNIFKLGTTFSKPLGLYFADKDGTRKPVVMGSYGIGTGRAMAAMVEVHHDKQGIVWPASVAPFQVHLIEISNPKLQSTNKFQKSNASKVYEKLSNAGIEVIFDDRDGVSAGEKLADADLIGCPIRAVVSDKTGAKIEIKQRDSNQTKLVTLDELVDEVENL